MGKGHSLISQKLISFKIKELEESLVLNKEKSIVQKMKMK